MSKLTKRLEELRDRFNSLNNTIRDMDSGCSASSLRDRMESITEIGSDLAAECSQLSARIDRTIDLVERIVRAVQID